MTPLRDEPARATPAARSSSPATRLAVAGLACTVLGWTAVFALLSAADGRSGQGLILLAQVVSSGVGPALVSASAVALLRGGRVLSAARSATALVCSTVAWSLAVVSTLSWSAGFDERDAGLPLSPLSEAFPVVFSAAVVVGAVAAACVWGVLLRAVSSPWLRTPLVALCSVPTAVVLGFAAVGPGLWGVAAVGVLVVSVTRSRRSTRTATAAVATPPPPRPR